MADLIFLDENGNEAYRRVKGRGRPPKGTTKGDDGNFYVHPIQESSFTPKYITIDENDLILSEETKGRGRPKPGYEKRHDGELSGHWVKRVDSDVASHSECESKNRSGEADVA